MSQIRNEYNTDLSEIFTEKNLTESPRLKETKREPQGCIKPQNHLVHTKWSNHNRDQLNRRS